MGDIKIKQTFSKLMETEKPEMTQEEAIMQYEEEDPLKKNKKNEDEDENTEETEHLKRIKKELLASLERVKQLAKRIYGDESNNKTKLNVKDVKGNAGKQQSKKIESDEKTANKEQKEKER